MKSYLLSELVDSLGCSYGKDSGELEVELEVAKVSNINGQGRFHKKFEKRSFSQKEVEKLSCKKGDLLVVKSSGSKKNILSGKTAICDFEHEGTLVATNFLMRLRPNKELVEPKYLWYVLNSEKTKNFIKTIVGTTTYPNLKWNMYGRLKVKLPTLAEQQRVTAILDKADEIKTTSEQTYLTRNSFLNTVFSDLFGDILTGHSTCEYATLKDCSQFIDYRGQSPPKSPHGIRLITAKNVKHGHLNYDPVEFIDEAQYETWMTRGFPELGDVLFTTEAPMGNAALWPDTEEKIAIAQRMICIRLDKRIKPEYFLWLILSDWFKLKMNRLATGSTAKGIKSSSLKKIEIPIPPLELQVQFGQIYNHYNSTNSKFEIQLSKSKLNILSITQDIFS